MRGSGALRKAASLPCNAKAGASTFFPQVQIVSPVRRCFQAARERLHKSSAHAMFAQRDRLRIALNYRCVPCIIISSGCGWRDRCRRAPAAS